MFPFSKPSKHHQHYDIVIQKCQIIVTKFTSSICANIHEQPFTKRYPHNNNSVHISSPTRTDVSLSYVLKNPQITLGGVYKKCSALSVWVCSKCSIIVYPPAQYMLLLAPRPGQLDRSKGRTHHITTSQTLPQISDAVWQQTPRLNHSHTCGLMMPHVPDMSLFTIMTMMWPEPHSVSGAWLRCSQ